VVFQLVSHPQRVAELYKHRTRTMLKM
jgi:hypothetical protein